MDERLSVPEFRGTNFGVWKVQLHALLAAKGLILVLTASDGDNQQAELKAADQQAMAIILLALDTKFVKLVMHCKSAKEVWTRLVSVHEQKSSGMKMTLQKQFYDCHMSNSQGESLPHDASFFSPTPVWIQLALLSTNMYIIHPGFLIWTR